MSIIEIAQKTRQAARKLAVLSADAKNQAIEAIAKALEASAPDILAANAADRQAAEADGIAKPLYDRLKLDEVKLKSAIAGVRDVAKLPDPIGAVQIHRELDAGLILKRVTCPLGVLGIIFEARPEALIQIVSLAIKSGNGVILKGGKEAVRSCEILTKVIHQALAETAVNPAAVQLLTTREETIELLKMDEYVDLIIPRGSNSFVRFVQENTRIPVLGHADGICHLYADKAADIQKAVEISVDAKTQYPAACNAIETLLVHRDIAHNFLPAVAQALQQKKVELRGDEPTRTILDIAEANEEDWSTEYSDLILSIKIVDSVEEAVNHINTYGSRHTDAIVTEDSEAAETFLNGVDAAGVYHNCSTRFSDGFRYGFGAEVGISTQQMPPRGPVGLEGLITYKYRVVGDGHIAASYVGQDAKGFTHREL
ncbi:MAG: glutamate-5-semialdehyde dehydrogenase [Microcoleus sp. PH2017_10_PVI_O_A]|uniref:glutamate-5-semialdehyde dehydrogenase n=1 Tax=unclassified Microcoleus TaxID=2642155 RepID=UPI001E13FCAA|nr:MULTISPECIES: glutamate-5-semialdehyde dehydrogenase [unclassified Microcoleus]TAE78768.1 MAG: glutamate-5-semialdehyde dehydrogenase [Oscillatoriales cyanobacterium]MCC3408672.1 glutamate-5-semialdehyde dehydrogenase [Microcoleus sp. PH2017_10_PVI_O_A]MCC3462779.1 glutamate-5-semialdehyde dehydrogenase [Microcoleus sp. PH2017_11_PCY_U_A]MCC3481211.1 glutamate-5-semialdehyde dehydrogenase [Microcoleus sp. PH2017_12_PCY_D_A]MCC3531233.1 glutamate-5-semialdehyde dehydrogenase [Microcoleus sp.